MKDTVLLSGGNSECHCKGHFQDLLLHMWQFISCNREMESLEACDAEAVCFHLQIPSSDLREQSPQLISLACGDTRCHLLHFWGFLTPLFFNTLLFYWGRIPCKYQQSPFVLLLHIRPLNSFLQCFLTTISLWLSVNMLKTLTVTLTGICCFLKSINCLHVCIWSVFLFTCMASLLRFE